MNPAMERSLQPGSLAMNAGGFWTPRRITFGFGLFAFLCVLLTLGDPGITVDEPLDVRPGRNYLRLLGKHGLAFLDPAVVDVTYADNHEHPPLGRWLLGIASTIGEPFETLIVGPDPFDTYIRSARLAPALGFALLVGLIVAETIRRFDRPSGCAAGLSLLMMPRLFAHAHFAVLDTFVALFWTWSLLSAAAAIESARPKRRMALAGVVWALALLTKIHAWLLPPLILAWAFFRLPWRKAVTCCAVWLAVGLAVFAIGWPWLWYDPSRLLDYLRTGVSRLSIQVQYFGHVYNDHDVPWHYPWLYFAATVPVGIHALGTLGMIASLRKSKRDARSILLLAAMLELLILFSLDTPVYDGERLFLPVFPLWAIFAGQGFGILWERWRSTMLRRAFCILIFAAQGYGVVMIHPFGLSYYNLFVGGLPGAERLGLELTFWGDAVDPVLLRELAAVAPAESVIALAPTLAVNQGPFCTTQPLLSRKLLVRDQELVPLADYIIIYRRTAYWNASIRSIADRPPLFVRKRQGVWLAGVWVAH
jgi:4-amino-4-deoxy-L-arabinose transferase-like glycosyltransferase